MAKEVSYEESWLKSESSSDIIPLDVMADEKSLSRVEAGLSSHVDVDVDGKKKKKRKAISNEADMRQMLAEKEQERRRKDSNLYQDIRALLPQLPPKADKATVVEEAIRVVMSLKQTLVSLENKKLERLCSASNNKTMASPVDVSSESLAVKNETASPPMNKNCGETCSVTFKTWNESNVAITVCGVDAFINVFSMRNPNLFSTVCYILEKHNLEVVYAQVSSDHAKTMYMLHVRANESAEGFSYEEMYKKVVAQINVFAEV